MAEKKISVKISNDEMIRWNISKNEVEQKQKKINEISQGKKKKNEDKTSFNRVEQEGVDKSNSYERTGCH